MMKKVKRSKKYFEPHIEDSLRKCDFEGCSAKGEYKAPKDRTLNEYYCFCLKHVQEYNAKWNYFAGMSEQDEEEEFKEFRSKNFKSRVNFSFGADSDFFDFYNNDFSMLYSKQEVKLFKIMEINPKEVSLELIKKQYKNLAKRYHPDLNQGDKTMEEKFKELTLAYEYLYNKFS